MNNNFIKMRSLIPPALNITLGPYYFNLQADVDHHGYSMNKSHFLILSIIVNVFYCNDVKCIKCGISD